MNLIKIDIQRAIQMYDSGMTFAAIAAELGCKPATLYRQIKQAGVQSRTSGAYRRGNPWPENRRKHHPVKPPRDLAAERKQKAITRFWEQVSEPDENGCRNWTGYQLKHGYGRYGFLGRKLLAHRMAWELAHGPIPECEGHHGTMSVCHRCDNPRCCNVDHLFLGTHLDNMKDRDAKGRTALNLPIPLRGDQNPSSKLTEADVADIRSARQAGATTVELGRRYGVHSSVISRAARGVTWANT